MSIFQCFSISRCKCWAGIMFFWVLKKETALKAVNEGSQKPIGSWFYPLGKYFYCAAALIALIAGAILGGIG